MSDPGWIDRLLRDSVPGRALGSRADKPILVTKERSWPIARLAAPVNTDLAYVVGIRDRELPGLARWLRAEAVRFYEMRVGDLAPLAAIEGLRHLCIDWNTKVQSIEPLRAVADLRTLVLTNTPKVRSLVPLESLHALRAFECSGFAFSGPGHTIDSLEPLSGLSLEEIRLTHCAVLAGGLRPLARIRTLRTLELSNQFETEDYAYLSVHLSEARCDKFAPYVLLPQALEDGRDVMVVGRRKPFLNSRIDAAKLRRYEARFRELQRQFETTIRP